MKLILFICISLLASLLHAAAMPIDGLANVGDAPMIHTSEEMKQSPHAHHTSMKQSADHDDAEDFCPDNQYSCCLSVILKPQEAMPVTSIFREAFYTSRSLNQPIFRLESLYRPPKFYPAPTG